ncbi:MAG: 2-oxoacid:acceptor oxidoreductase family protein [Dehalococcoidia bacterium]
MKRRRWEVRMAGQGGQGLGLAGIILAEAAVRDGKNAVMTHFYGAQQRGGPSRADVVISNEKIDYPQVLDADVLVIFSEVAFDRYHHQLASDGFLLVDSSQAKGALVEGAKSIPIPFADIAQQVTGSSISANLVALGFVVELTKLVSRRALVGAVRKHSPEDSLQANQTALERGIQIAGSIMGGNRSV